MVNIRKQLFIFASTAMTLLIVFLCVSIFANEKAFIKIENYLASINEGPREKFNFDYGWKFSLGEGTYASESQYNHYCLISDPTNCVDKITNPNSELYEEVTNVSVVTEASNPYLNSYDVSSWEDVSLPHTYNDVDTFDNYTELGGTGQNGERATYTGTAWYKKEFFVPNSYQGKKVYIEFEAARQALEIYVNGAKLNYIYENGFIPVGFDLTPYLLYNQTNIITVMTDNSFPYKMEGTNSSVTWHNSHWHPNHGGLYRNSYLYVVDDLHLTLPLYSFIEGEGTYVYATDIEIDENSKTTALINVDAQIENSTDTPQTFTIEAILKDKDGNPVNDSINSTTITLASGGKEIYHLEKAYSDLIRWSTAYPYLYTVETKIIQNGQTIDNNETTIGIRSVKFTSDYGFYLNENYLELNGWGQKSTMEWAGLGAAYPDWMTYYVIELMKDANANYIRWGHTAGSPVQIKATDELGILVTQPGVDSEGSTSGGFYDNNTIKLRIEAFRDMLIYYRNNPSIIMWELGNQGNVTSVNLSENYINSIKGLDFSQTTGTCSIFDILYTLVEQYDYGNRSNENTNASTFDLARSTGDRATTIRHGISSIANYIDVSEATLGASTLSGKPIVESEYNRLESRRAIWDQYTYPNFTEATYNKTAEVFAKSQIKDVSVVTGQPEIVAKTKYTGGANWIFSDSTSHGRIDTEVVRASGEVDAVMLPKEAYFVDQVIFDDEPAVHIIGHWNYPVGTVKDVYVAARNVEAVTLYVGDTLYTGELSNSYLWTFSNVSYANSVIRVEGKDRYGNVVVTDSITPHGEPASIRLSYITSPSGLLASGSDVVLVDAEIIDSNGNRCSTYDGTVTGDYTTFTLTDPNNTVIWRGGYNSGIEKSTNSNKLYLEAGINRVSLRTTKNAGTFTLTATTDSGLTSNTLAITSTSIDNHNGLSDLSNPIPTYSLAGLVDPGVGNGTKLGIVPREEEVTTASVLITNLGYTGGVNAGNGIAEVFSIGAKMYSDSNALFTKAPYSMLNAEYLKLPNSDRNVITSDLITFEAKRNIDLFVLRDPRVALPAWMDGYVLTPDHVVGSNGINYDVYKNSVSVGTYVTMGSNSDTGNTEDGVGHIILFKATPSVGEFSPFFKENFDNFDLESLITMWDPDIPAGNSVLVENHGGTHGNTLRLLDLNDKLVFVQKSFSPISTGLTFKFDVFIDDTVQSWLNVWLTQGKTVQESVKDGVAVESYLFSDGSNVTLRGRVFEDGVITKAVKPLTGNLPVNQWHTFEIDVDTVNNAYRVKADAGSYSDWAPFYAPQSSINTLLFGTHSTGNSDYLIDNIEIIPDVVETISNVRIDGVTIASYDYEITDYYVGSIDENSVLTFDQELQYQSSSSSYNAISDTLSLEVTDALGMTKTYHFHDQSTSDLLSTWEVTSPENTLAEVIKVGESEVFNFYDNNNSDILYITKNIPVSTNKVAIRWSAKVGSDAENLFLRVWALDGALIDTNTKTNVLVGGYMNREGSNVQYVNEHTLSGTDGTFVYSSDYQTADEWHNYEAIIDIPNNSYNLYVDGILSESNMEFLNNLTRVDTIVIGTGTDATSHFYLKDVEAETIYDTPLTGINIEGTALEEFSGSTFVYEYYTDPDLTAETLFDITYDDTSYLSHTITKDLLTQIVTIEITNINEVTYTYTVEFLDPSQQQVTKAELQQLVDEIEALNSTDYSISSWSSLMIWVNKANTLLEEAEPDIADMSEAYHEIEVAQSDLLIMQNYSGTGIALIRDIKYSEDLEGLFHYDTVLDNGVSLYADVNSPTFRSVPVKYMNAGYFVVPNVVTNAYGELSFVTNRPLDVLVLRDRNAGAVTRVTYDNQNNPIRYTDTGEIATSSDGTVYKIYRKSYAAGATVTIDIATVVRNNITNKANIIAIKDSYNVANKLFFYENMDLYTTDGFKYAWNAHEPDDNNYVELVPFADGDTTPNAIHVVSNSTTAGPIVYREFAKMYKKYNVSYSIFLYEDTWDGLMNGWYNRFSRVWLINDSQNVNWRTSFNSSLKPKICVLEAYLNNGNNGTSSNYNSFLKWDFMYATKSNGTARTSGLQVYRGQWMDISLDVDMAANTFTVSMTRDVGGNPTTTTGSGELYGGGFTYADFIEFAGRETGRSSYWLKDVSITPQNDDYLTDITVTNNDVTGSVTDYISKTKDYLYHIDDIDDITVTPTAGSVNSTITQENVLENGILNYTHITSTVGSDPAADHRVYYELSTDRLRLTTLIENAMSLSEESYTADSWANLQIALNSALAVLPNQMASQATIDAEANQLESAITALIGLETLNVYYTGKLYYGNTLEANEQSTLHLYNKGSFTFDVNLHSDVGTSYTYAVVPHNRTIESSVVFPVNTKITFIDNSEETPNYYYYIVTSDDVSANKKSYPLIDFTKMGSTVKFVNTAYYNAVTGIVNIDFSFIVDFEVAPALPDGLYTIHMQDSISGQTIDMDPLTYNLYDVEFPKELSVSFGEQSYYGDEIIEAYVNSTTEHPIVDGNEVYDTRRLDQKIGVKMTVYKDGSQIDLPLGTVMNYGGNACTVINNSCTIPLHDMAVNMEGIVTISFGDYAYLEAGTYAIRFDYIASPNGINLGSIFATVTEGVTISSRPTPAIRVNLDSIQTNILDVGITKTLSYDITKVGVDNPNVVISLEKKNGNSYTQIALANYTEDELAIYSTNKYSLNDALSLELQLKNNLPIGSYRLLFELCDGTGVKADTYKYIIVK